MKKVKKLLSSNKGLGTVELILIIVVLISLVFIFKTQMTSLVNTIFSKITTQAGTIYNG